MICLKNFMVDLNISAANENNRQWSFYPFWSLCDRIGFTMCRTVLLSRKKYRYRWRIMACPIHWLCHKTITRQIFFFFCNGMLWLVLATSYTILALSPSNTVPGLESLNFYDADKKYFAISLVIFSMRS